MQTESASAQDRVDQLWQTLDTRGVGYLDHNGLKKGLRKIDHPLKNADALLADVLKAVDTSGDGKIQYEEFCTFVRETEKQLLALFKTIDKDDNGKLDKAELRAAFQKAGLAVQNSKLDDFFEEVDTNRDGVITFDEWRNFLLFIPSNQPSLRAVMSYFSSTVTVNPEGDVHISDETVEGLGTTQRFPMILFGAIARIAFPANQVQPSTKDVPKISRPEQDTVHTLQERSDACTCTCKVHAQDKEIATKTWKETTWYVWDYCKLLLTDFLPAPGYFIAGGIAGVVSRTATAPFDRLKVYLIAQTGLTREAVDAAKQGDTVQAAKKATKPIVDACKALWRAGGIRSLFAGNGLNVVKVMPESAIKFGSYEGSKRALARVEGHGDPAQLSSISKFFAGGLGGIISQFCVYPLDTLKFRMQCETVEGGLHGNALIADVTRKMWAQNGVRAFYRGLPMGLIGMFPYAAIDLGTFEYLKRSISRRNAKLRGCHEEDAMPGSVATAAIGAFSGALGASIVYPLNLLRTRLQAQGTAIHPPTYTGIWDVTSKTVKNEGVRGLFRGLTPNLLKVVPAVSITYVVYENSKKMLSLK